MDIKVILLAVAIVGISVAAIAIKMFLVKGGEFEKVCGSIDPKTGKTIPCTCKSGEVFEQEACDNADKEE